jgi:hypothetical protein
VICLDDWWWKGDGSKSRYDWKGSLNVNASRAGTSYWILHGWGRWRIVHRPIEAVARHIERQQKIRLRSEERGYQSIETGTLVDHSCLQKYSIVYLTNEKDFMWDYSGRSFCFVSDHPRMSPISSRKHLLIPDERAGAIREYADNTLKLPPNRTLIGAASKVRTLIGNGNIWMVFSCLAGDSGNIEAQVWIRSEMEQKIRGTIGQPVLITKICQAWAGNQEGWETGSLKMWRSWGIRKPFKYFLDLWISECFDDSWIRAFEAAPIKVPFVGSSGYWRFVTDCDVEEQLQRSTEAILTLYWQSGVWATELNPSNFDDSTRNICHQKVM